MKGHRRLIDCPGVRADELPGEIVRRGTRWLGREVDSLVVDLWDGLDPDLVAAAVGSVRGGGTVWVARPDGDLPVSAGLLVWPYGERDVGRRFDRRFLASLREIAGVAGDESARGEFATDDQRRAVDHLVRSLKRKRRPVVVLADRGRGKTAALGLAIARALDEQLVDDVLVTAEHPDALRSMLDRLGADAFPVERGGRVVRFAPPDEVDARGTGWLVVDEAAQIPVDRLLRWAEQAPRLALATTVHGYEGTGRAFAIRFLPKLLALRPRTTVTPLAEPARWDPGDPVEAWLADAFLLDAEPADPVEPYGAPERMDRDRLDGAALRDVFGLLVGAHYRTRPSDLRRMLDGPNLSLWAVRGAHGLGAVALVAEEGGLPDALAAAIGRGETRPLGHLVPEVLGCHLGRPELAGLRGRRIVRIAVHPAARRRGVGRALIDAIARGAGDWVAASFLPDLDLLRFWESCGLRLVRAADGALLVLGGGLADGLADRFSRDLPAVLADALRDLDPDLAVGLLRRTRTTPALDDQDRREIEAVAHGTRKVEWSMRAVREHVLAALPAASLEDEDARVLVERAVQLRSWDRMAADRGVHRHAVTAAFRTALARLGGPRGDTIER